MKILTKITILIIAASMLQSCNDGMNKQGAGTLIGGVAGALVGSRFGKGSGALFATGAGAIAGAVVGGSIGKNMDDNDKKIAELTSQRALESSPSGKSVEWRNPDNGHYGYVTPTKTFQSQQGAYCREYTQVIVVGGKEERAYGRACRQQDGSWQIAQ